MAALVANNIFTLIFIKYCDFADFFSLKLTFKLFKYIEINNHTI